MRCQYEPSSRFVNFLISEYHIGSRFKHLEFFSDENNLILDRYFNENDFCSVLKNSLKFKLSKRKLSYLDKNLIKKQINFKFILSFKFIVVDKKR